MERENKWTPVQKEEKKIDNMFIPKHMTREERKQLVDQFLDKIEKQFEEFEKENGIAIKIDSFSQSASQMNGFNPFPALEAVWRRTKYNFLPYIPHAENHWEYVYGDNTLGDCRPRETKKNGNKEENHDN